jgi:hypothetical protein
MAGIFWVAAGLLLLTAIPTGQKSWGILIPAIVTGQFMAIAATAITMEFPYRQTQPLQRNQIVVPLGKEDSALKLSPELADYALALMYIAESKGFRSGDPLLDFTGQAPGAALVLGAKAVGQPWLLGGYRGSRAFVDATLNGVDCEVIARAWILAGPSNRRALPLDILERHGVYVEHQYEVVGTALAHDQDRNKPYEQVLYRPSRSPEVAKHACEGKRRLAPPSQHVNNSGAH